MKKYHVKSTRNAWTEFRATLANKHFWVLMGWTFLVFGVAGFLFWVAIRNWDSAMTLRPMVCRGGGNTDWHILMLVLVAPFFVISLLGAISEMWHNLERRQHHVHTRWKPFFVFSGLILVLGAAILAILNC